MPFSHDVAAGTVANSGAPGVLSPTDRWAPGSRRDRAGERGVVKDPVPPGDSGLSARMRRRRKPARARSPGDGGKNGVERNGGPTKTRFKRFTTFTLHMYSFYLKLFIFLIFKNIFS